jgi:PIN domain
VVRVYLETSFLSACVTTRTTSRAIYEREMSVAWLESEESACDVFLADPVIAELSAPAYRDREAALELAARFKIETITPAIEDFAALLAKRFVMPQDLQGDALHVAAAIVLKADLLLTWNVKHLANQSK